MSDATEATSTLEIQTMVIVSRVKDYVDDLYHELHPDAPQIAKLRFSHQFAEALNLKVAELVHAAMERALANGRVTLNSYDL